jgi:hypothetical protein
MQRDMGLMGAARTPTLAPAELIETCRHRLDAIRLCVQLSHLPNGAIADDLQIDRGHWTRIMQGQANFPDTKSVSLMQLCGNYAPLQYEALACGFDLQKRERETRIRELEAELNRLRRTA